MKIEICIKDRATFDIANNIFQDISEITVTQNTITNAQYSTIISAGNSFAEMNGGILLLLLPPPLLLRLVFLNRLCFYAKFFSLL